MIGVIFQFGSEIVEVRVQDSNLFFRTQNSQQFGDISGLKLDRSGVMKEFPDLIDKEDWRKQAQDRLKEKIKQMKNEEERIKYVIEDLSKFGYKLYAMQKQGFRPVIIK
jgi:hypothetical protein